MKNLFNNITSEERERILEMHKTATKRGYLMKEQGEGEDSGINKLDLTSSETLNRLLNVSSYQNESEGLLSALGLGDKDYDTVKELLSCAFEKYGNNITNIAQVQGNDADKVLLNCITTVADKKSSEISTDDDYSDSMRKLMKLRDSKLSNHRGAGEKFIEVLNKSLEQVQ